GHNLPYQELQQNAGILPGRLDSQVGLPHVAQSLHQLLVRVPAGCQGSDFKCRIWIPGPGAASVSSAAPMGRRSALERLPEEISDTPQQQDLRLLARYQRPQVLESWPELAFGNGPKQFSDFALLAKSDDK